MCCNRVCTFHHTRLHRIYLFNYFKTKRLGKSYDKMCHSFLSGSVPKQSAVRNLFVTLIEILWQTGNHAKRNVCGLM